MQCFFTKHAWHWITLNMYMLGVSLFLGFLRFFFSIRDIELINDTVKSHLLVDWMVTEWWLNDDWMVTGKVDFWCITVTIQWSFSRMNGRNISVTIQSVYFLKNKMHTTPNAARTWDVRIIGKAIMYLELVLLIFYSFHNHLLSFKHRFSIWMHTVF